MLAVGHVKGNSVCLVFSQVEFIAVCMCQVR